MRITYCTHLPSILSRLSAVFSQLCTSYPPCHTKLSVAHVSRSYKILIRLFCSWVTQIFIKHKEGTNHNRLHYDQTRCKRPCIFLAHSATVYPLCHLFPCFLQLFIPPSTLNPVKEIWCCIYSCVRALWVAKSRRWTFLLGKSTDPLFTALGLLLLLLYQDRSTPPSLSPPSFNFLPFHFYFQFPSSNFSGISGLVTDSNVNHWKPFSQKETQTWTQ